MLGRLSRDVLFDANKLLRIQILALAATLIVSSSARADTTYASEQRKNAAEGHYARARAMLVEALAEFEQGRKYARPDMLLDPEEWRLSVVSRTEELNRILDPKPRVTRDGVRFQADKLMIRRERDRTPPAVNGARDNNTYGEERRLEENRKARARMEAPEDTETEELQVVPSAKAPVAVPAVPEGVKKAPAVEAAKKAEQSLSFKGAPVVDEDAEETVTTTTTTVHKEVIDQPAGAAVTPPKSTEIDTSVHTAEQEGASPDGPVKATRVIQSEEEVVTTKKSDGTKKTLFTEQDDDELDSSAKSEASGAKEDDVQREIENAIQQRIQKEKSEKTAAVEDAE